MNLRGLDLNLLLVFDTVYRTRSNTKAAEELGLTQSAVSNAVKRLRGHLSDPLFQRSGNRLETTREADRIAPAIRDALRTVQETISLANVFDPKASDRVFTIVMPDSMEPIILTGMSRQIQAEGLNVKIHTHPFVGVDIRESILEKKIDVALLPNLLTEPDISTAYLMEEDACIIVRADHPVYGTKNEFTIEDMSKADLVGFNDDIRRHTHLDHEMRAKSVNRNHVAFVSRLWSVPYLVASTDLVGACSEVIVKAVGRQLNLKSFKLPLDRPTHHWHMVWNETFNDDAGHMWLRGRIQNLIKEWTELE
ncbi:LysR family transcriptional regulator [Labrenzia sp. PHM005]|uniref:LysR family transcriptional regulator n=1 Tax=Stappiaceae TaxID=2821832 RepID=UPI00113FFDD7|nr:LysR family transcriptional regulator [Labrenzia sp. PHM005]QDG76571.1 LysR family transcriptional regulator [Labrenzia sp. PHM005]